VADCASHRFATFLERALALLARESPPHLTATMDGLGERALSVAIDRGPAVRVCFAAQRVVAMSDIPGEIAVAIADADLRRFLAGRVTVEEAVIDGSLAVRGRLDDVRAFLDALAAWLHGALRTPALALLLHEYLAQTPAHPETRGGCA
jgi:hypothetical protein